MTTDLRVVRRRRPLIVAVDAEPLHLAAVRDVLAPDHRDVVLGLAGDHAGAAARALGQVDGHAPLVGLLAVVDRLLADDEGSGSRRSSSCSLKFESFFVQRRPGWWPWPARGPPCDQWSWVMPKR